MGVASCRSTARESGASELSFLGVGELQRLEETGMELEGQEKS